MENNGLRKKNQPELLVDWNGNAVQHAWVLGGKTIEVTANNDFVCESTLMRVCNAGTEVAFIKLKNADYSEIPNPNAGLSDQGIPILPGTAEMVAVFNEGQVYSVSGENLYVTFMYDRRVKY